jgi:hypothetical protein
LSGHEFFPFLSAKVQNILHREHREQGFFEHVYVVQIVVTTKNCNSSYNFGIVSDRGTGLKEEVRRKRSEV